MSWILYTQMWVLSLFFSMALLLFIKTYHHALSTLLAIEFLALYVYLTLSFFAIHSPNESFALLFFLTLAVCEGALGLSLVVTLARTKGTNFMTP